MLCILWAEGVPQSDPTTVGTWVLVAMGLLGGGLGIAKLLKDLMSKPADKESVTKKEFEELKLETGRIENRLTDLSGKRFEEIKTSLAKTEARFAEYATRREFDDMRAMITKQLESLDKYSRTRTNRLAGQVHEVQMKIEVLHRNIQAEIGTVMGKVSERLERLQRTTLELRTLVEHRLPRRTEVIGEEEEETPDAK